MADTTRTGFGIGIQFANGFFAEIIDVTPPNQTREAIETTHTQTPEGWATFEPSDVADAGELQVEMAFHPDSPVPVKQPKESITITFPSGTTWAFLGFLTEHAPAAPIDDRMTASVTIKVSGKITVTPAP